MAVCTREACTAYTYRHSVNCVLEELNRKILPYTAFLPGITIAWMYTKGDSSQYLTYMIPRTEEYFYYGY